MCFRIICVSDSLSFFHLATECFLTFCRCRFLFLGDFIYFCRFIQCPQELKRERKYFDTPDFFSFSAQIPKCCARLQNVPLVSRVSGYRPFTWEHFRTLQTLRHFSDFAQRILITFDFREPHIYK